MVSKLCETVLIGSKSGSQLVIMRVHLIQFQINEDEKTIQKLQHDQEISLQEVRFLMIEVTLNEQAQFFIDVRNYLGCFLCGLRDLKVDFRTH